jgi:hypothetical protein
MKALTVLESDAAIAIESGISATVVAFLQTAVLRMIPYSVPAIVIILLDLLYGVKAARHRGEKVRFSTAVRRTTSKIVSYICWLILASTLAISFEKDWLEWAVLGLVYVNEFASIIGNYLETKGIEFSFVNLYRWIIKVIAGKAGEAMDSAEAEEIIKPKRKKPGVKTPDSAKERKNQR